MLPFTTYLVEDSMVSKLSNVSERSSQSTEKQPHRTEDDIVPPPELKASANPVRVLVIGAGSRGCAYAEAIRGFPNAHVVAVAEPDAFKREQFSERYCIERERSEGVLFADWKEFIDYEKQRRLRAQTGSPTVEPGVDAVFVCVLDEMHREVVVALSELGGLHIMCEKPLATNLDDCMEMYTALEKNQDKVFSIGHVLRYSPHNMALRKLLLEDRVIGDILSINHTEPVGWWHFTHSYVRGNWRREDTSAPSLLTKSCHDIDVLLWILCSPPSYTNSSTPPHVPSTVSSTGALQLFKKSRKPASAGNATNCLSCPIEPECKYSAKRIYVTDQLNGLGTGNTNWPVKIVVPDIETYDQGEERQSVLLTKLAENYTPSTPDSVISSRNWFGRCVWESDNDVCDEQVVTMTWDEDPVSGSLQNRGAKTATFHMVAHTKKICERYTHIYGVDGEIYADGQTITIEDFNTGNTRVVHPRQESFGHGGGDVGLARQFILAVDKVKNHGWQAQKAQREIVRCTLDEVIRSHAMVFCAEEARKGRKVLDWRNWWDAKVGAL
ncbi:hypothetical protein DL546_004762 [Coniochaeta pulveracea]|uniref:Gfo/Idh/MocA-like oxidoreductase N-terminal domain-containing protein n=1 Tax=Coniochaeta pulveracea TaxID=177199 RepID=A0A420Y169_9PEZI|nr:hypothetical protein DL546_004762 [Coniochaeta pulveracea]